MPGRGCGFGDGAYRARSFVAKRLARYEQIAAAPMGIQNRIDSSVSKLTARRGPSPMPQECSVAIRFESVKVLVTHQPAAIPASAGRRGTS